MWSLFVKEKGCWFPTQNSYLMSFLTAAVLSDSWRWIITLLALPYLGQVQFPSHWHFPFAAFTTATSLPLPPKFSLNLMSFITRRSLLLLVLYFMLVLQSISSSLVTTAVLSQFCIIQINLQKSLIKTCLLPMFCLRVQFCQTHTNPNDKGQQRNNNIATIGENKIYFLKIL